MPAVCAVGLPACPVAVPGAAVSPGSNTCNCAKAPTLTVIAGLVLAALVPSELSVAVTVRVPPAVLNFTPKVCVPLARAALDGSAALGSLDVMATVSPAVLTRFQFASTALTVTLKGLSVFCAVAELV